MAGAKLVPERHDPTEPNRIEGDSQDQVQDPDQVEVEAGVEVEVENEDCRAHKALLIDFPVTCAGESKLSLLAPILLLPVIVHSFIRIVVN